MIAIIAIQITPPLNPKRREMKTAEEWADKCLDRQPSEAGFNILSVAPFREFVALVQKDATNEKDILFCLDILQKWLYQRQLHTRKGSHGGKIKQQPLANAAQGEEYNLIRKFLIKHGRGVPREGTLLDG